MSLTKKYDQLIQTGFQMIVSAFDEQSGNYENIIEKLKNDIKNLLNKNKELKEKNSIYIKQIQSLKETNANLLEKLKRKDKGINKIINTLEDKQNNIEYNSNDISFHNNEKETEELLNSSEDLGNNRKISRNRNMLFSTVSENRSTYTNILDNNPIIHKTQMRPLFKSPNEEKLFIKNCKENLHNKIYHNIIMLVNSYKSGLLTTIEVSSKIRSILSHNKDIISSFSNVLFN